MTAILPDLAAFLESVDDVEPTADVTAYGVTPDFSFAPDDLGYVYYPGSSQNVFTEDQRTLLIWIEKALRTPRGTYPIYGSDYGTDLAASLGRHSVLDEILLGGEDDVRRCLLVHPLIVDVPTVSFTRALERDSVLLFISIVDRIGGPGELQVVI